MIPIGVTLDKLQNFTTTDLAEGENLYFTQERAQDFLAEPQTIESLSLVLKSVDRIDGIDSNTYGNSPFYLFDETQNKIAGVLFPDLISEIRTNLSNYFRSFGNVVTINDENLNVDQNISYVGTRVRLTTNRIITLSANNLIGKDIIISDDAKAINANNTLEIKVATGKKLNGITNGSEYIVAAGGQIRLFNDGSGNWYFDDTIIRTKPNKFIYGTNYTLTDKDAHYFLVFPNSAICTVTVPNSLTKTEFQGSSSDLSAKVYFVGGTGVTVNAVTDNYKTFKIRFISGTSPKIYNISEN